MKVSVLKILTMIIIVCASEDQYQSIQEDLDFLDQAFELLQSNIILVQTGEQLNELEQQKILPLKEIQMEDHQEDFDSGFAWIEENPIKQTEAQQVESEQDQMIRISDIALEIIQFDQEVDSPAQQSFQFLSPAQSVQDYDQYIKSTEQIAENLEKSTEDNSSPLNQQLQKIAKIEIDYSVIDDQQSQIQDIQKDIQENPTNQPNQSWEVIVDPNQTQAQSQFMLKLSKVTEEKPINIVKMSVQQDQAQDVTIQQGIAGAIQPQDNLDQSVSHMEQNDQQFRESEDLPQITKDVVSNNDKTNSIDIIQEADEEVNLITPKIEPIQVVPLAAEVAKQPLLQIDELNVQEDDDDFPMFGSEQQVQVRKEIDQYETSAKTNIISEETIPFFTSSDNIKLQLIPDNTLKFFETPIDFQPQRINNPDSDLDSKLILDDNIDDDQIEIQHVLDSDSKLANNQIDTQNSKSAEQIQDFQDLIQKIQEKSNQFDNVFDQIMAKTPETGEELQQDEPSQIKPVQKVTRKTIQQIKDEKDNKIKMMQTLIEQQLKNEKDEKLKSRKKDDIFLRIEVPRLNYIDTSQNIDPKQDAQTFQQNLNKPPSNQSLQDDIILDYTPKLKAFANKKTSRNPLQQAQISSRLIRPQDKERFNDEQLKIQEKKRQMAIRQEVKEFLLQQDTKTDNISNVEVKPLILDENRSLASQPLQAPKLLRHKI